MKAAITTNYGSPGVIKILEVKTPVAQDHEIQIKIHAATVILGDSEIRRFKIPILFWLPLRLYMGVFKPRIKIYGQELSGIVASVGNKVTKFSPGEKVFLATDMSLGAHAEYKCISEHYHIARIPEGMSFETAAAIPVGGSNALHFVRKAKLKQGEKVLIIGAGGSIGTFAVQLAKLNGAEVTCVDKGIKKNMLTAIGADHFIDYEKLPLTDISHTYDVIIDIVGKATVPSLLKLLNQKGRLILGNPGVQSLLQGFWLNKKSEKRVISKLASYRVEDYNYLSELVLSGQLKVIIDKTYPLEQIRDAHAYVDSGKKAGHIVIKIVSDND
jgi:NADPH:quinone reductase-like Zn-dependent oxidoreductase